MNTKQFLKALNAVGYTTEYTFPEYVTKIDENDGKEYNFNFEIETTNFCCGVQEIGEVSFNDENLQVLFTSKKKEHKNLLQALVLLATNELLREIGPNRRGKVPKASQFIFTGNGTPTSKMVGMALLATGRFKEVCKTINPGSNRELTTYIGV